MYNGFDFQGSVIEVREDRFPSAGGGRGGFGGGRGRGGYGGGGRGGFAAGAFAGPFGAYGAMDPSQFAAFGGAFGGMPLMPKAFGGGFGHAPAQPSTQIYVRNVSSRTALKLLLARLTQASLFPQLPWSTSDEDLVELFQTTGTVEHAEIVVEGGRSKGAGIVQFATVEEAETAIAKFQSYSYGGEWSGMYVVAAGEVMLTPCWPLAHRSTVDPRVQRQVQEIWRCTD